MNKVVKWVRERFYSFRSKAGYVTTKVQLAIVGAFVGLSSLSVFAEGEIAAMQTAASGYISDAVTAVAALALAGLAIAGILWGVRKIKAGIRSA